MPGSVLRILQMKMCWKNGSMGKKIRAEWQQECYRKRQASLQLIERDVPTKQHDEYGDIPTKAELNKASDWRERKKAISPRSGE